MFNVQNVNYLRSIIGIVIILILGIAIIKFTTSSLLTINTAEAIKTDLFKERAENNSYYNYMNIFENYIVSGKYNEAYSLLNEYNAKEKFSSLDDFKEKMSYIYSSDKNYHYNVEEIIEKVKYKDVYIKTYVSYKDSSKIETGIVEFMIREYSTFDYKIYLRTDINELV